MTADDKNCPLNTDNLTEAIQMQLYQNQKTFSEFFLPFLKSVLNFKKFPEKDEPHGWFISRNTGSEKHA